MDGSIPQKIKLLIICEGKNTEPSYFKQFRYPATIETIDIEGTGYNTVSLVEYAEKRKQEAKYQHHKVWCVFDADPKAHDPNQLVHFNNAIKKAEALGFNVAYSHQAFEYWLILHFEDHQGGPMHRDLYAAKINKYLKAIDSKVVYDKDRKEVSESFFNIMLAADPKTHESRQVLALKRAKKIYSQYDHQNPAKEESSTTVFKLVWELFE
jgi:hypothetical protein